MKIVLSTVLRTYRLSLLVFVLKQRSRDFDLKSSKNVTCKFVV